MTPANITSIIIASISALASLATIAYVSIKTKFQDKQDTSIKITTKETRAESQAEIVITLTNDESFSHKMTSLKNGNSDNKPNLLSIIDSDTLEFEDDKGDKDKDLIKIKNTNSKEIKKSTPHPKFLQQLKENTTTSFTITEDKSSPTIKEFNNNFSQNALQTNSDGDKLIADNRDNLGKKALFVFGKIAQFMFSKDERKEQIIQQDKKFSTQIDDFFGDTPRESDSRIYKPIIKVPPSFNKKDQNKKEKEKKEEKIEINNSSLIQESTIIELTGDNEE